MDGCAMCDGEKLHGQLISTGFQATSESTIRTAFEMPEQKFGENSNPCCCSSDGHHPSLLPHLHLHPGNCSRTIPTTAPPLAIPPLRSAYQPNPSLEHPTPTPMAVSCPNSHGKPLMSGNYTIERLNLQDVRSSDRPVVPRPTQQPKNRPLLLLRALPCYRPLLAAICHHHTEYSSRCCDFPCACHKKPSSVRICASYAAAAAAAHAPRSNPRSKIVEQNKTQLLASLDPQGTTLCRTPGTASMNAPRTAATG